MALLKDTNPLKRKPWLLLAFFAGFLVVFAHAVFQKWLFMEPCEQCVYIRFAFVVVAIGALVIALKPSSLVISLTGIALSFYGAIYGLLCSLKLAKIHAAMHSEAMDALFGLEGCSTNVHYPLGLPLDSWFPEWFAATGECGIDTPVVPTNAVLNAFQSYWIDLYNAAGGWYLIPPLKWLNMAECCAVFSAVFILLLFVLSLKLFFARKANC
jgi:disulfide bond formation protein DsbB